MQAVQEQALDKTASGASRELLKQFGGLQAIAGAGVEDLTQVRGISRRMAEAIYEHLHPDS